MKRHLHPWIVAAGIALGAAGCADGDGDGPAENVAVTRQAVSQDVTPPQIVCTQPGDCTVDPLTADATAGPAEVHVTAHLTDAPAGLSSAVFYFRSPSGAQANGAIMAPGDAVSGDAFDGVFRGTMTLPRFSEPGAWTSTGAFANDIANNWHVYQPSELAALGFPTTITVLSQSDTTAPVLHCVQPGDCALGPAAIDASAGPVQIALSARFADAPAGFQLAVFYFTSPSGAQTTGGTMLEGDLSSGTMNDGVFHGMMTVPQFAEGGLWKVSSIFAIDQANNIASYTVSEAAAAGFPTTFTVTSAGDTTGPVLVCAQPGDCEVAKASVDTTAGPAQIDVRARFVDAPAGLGLAALYYRSPSGGTATGAALLGTSLISGTAQDGVFGGTLQVQQFAELGVWTVSDLFTTDNANNHRDYARAEIAATGFPMTLHVCHAKDACNDANACTTGEACSEGFCIGGAPVDCDDGNICTDDACDAATGCTHTASSCDDGNPCTTDACDPNKGCTHTFNANPCDDGNVCTSADHCASGACIGTTVSCDDGNPCTTDSCAPGAGCAHEAREGTCDDGNPCTAEEKCVAGVCNGGHPVTCDDAEECTVDSCNPAVGCVFTPREGSCGPAPGGCTTGGVCFSGHCTVGTVCGDHVCCTEGGENSCNCPSDCQDPPGTPKCGNGCCSADENACSCPEDCTPSPNDGLCCGYENACNSQDCGPDTCGNGCCGPNETSCNCPADCGAQCGDGCCGGGEDACSCPTDCQPSPSDGLCCGAENACNSKDCGPDTCGNGCCGKGETPCSCPADCGQVVCGDGVCAGCGEDKCSCPADCGQKQDFCADDCASKCGDGCCGIRPDGTPEDACNCVEDCATRCGDGCCSGGEDGCSCPEDCGAPSCGDHKCEACAGETPCGCPADCGSADDGACCGGENGCSSPDDCGPPALHNHLCEPCNGETSCSAPDDCGAACNDGCCNGGEDGCSCKSDCGAPFCGNGHCEACTGEDACSCPADCGGPAACGDGRCCGGESSCGCVADCGGIIHGDAQCCANEDVCDEAACGPVAGGDGLCCPGENVCGEPTCGPGTCGDGCCGPTETPCGCPQDCAQLAQPVCVAIQRDLAGNVADAFLAGDDPNWPTGSEQNLWIGRSSGGNENRSIYRFGLGVIPQGATITSATLMVWLSSSVYTATITVHPLLQPWNEATVTGANYGNPAFFDQAIAGSFIASGDGGYKSVDVKDLVAAWVSGARPNFGVGLTEPPIGTHHTFSSESPSMGVRPKLNVCYFACGQ